MFIETDVIKVSQYSLRKLKSLGLRLATLKEENPTQVFSVNFAEFLKTTFL